MKTGWLRNQLVKSKQNSLLWPSLADAIESVFSWRIGDIERRVVTNRSLLTMSADEIKIKQSELGHFFSVLDVERDEFKGLAILHRHDHIHLKATDFPIKDVVKRAFSGFDMVWQARFAPVDQVKFPYGSRFITQNDYEKLSEESRNNYFLTSRGIMLLNLTNLSLSNAELDHIYGTIKETVVPMIPLHIVYDGFFAQIDIEAVFDIHLHAKLTEHVTDNYLSIAEFETSLGFVSPTHDFIEISNEAFSVDSETKNIRKDFQYRTVPLLGEIPLDAYRLGAAFDISSEIESLKNKNLGAELLSGASWNAVNCTLTKVDSSITASGQSGGRLHHVVNLEVGATYFVKVNKESVDSGEAHISTSNDKAASILKLTSHSNFKGCYVGKFKATSSVMYIVLIKSLPLLSFFDLSIKKYTNN